MSNGHDEDDKQKDDDEQNTRSQGGREIIPLAAAAFLGALAGAVIGSAVS